MSFVTNNYGYWEFWAPISPANGYYGSQKCTFDGINKQIIVNPGETEISVKQDLYSAWKEWVQVRNNARYLPAFRTIGGDPVGGGQYAGDIYFLKNGWQIVVNSQVNFQGILYHDDSISPFIINSGGGVTSTVSNLAQNVGFQGTVNVTAEPNILPKDVWDYLVSEASTPGSVGERLSKLLTVAKFLGLK